jgi:hypothetical protein
LRRALLTLVSSSVLKPQQKTSHNLINNFFIIFMIWIIFFKNYLHFSAEKLMIIYFLTILVAIISISAVQIKKILAEDLLAFI